MDLNKYMKIRDDIIKDYKSASSIVNLPVKLQELVLDMGGGQAIKYITCPDVYIQEKAFKMDPAKAVPYITDERLLLDIIKIYPKAIMYVINPSKQLQLECVRKNKKFVKDIMDPCDEVLQFLRYE